ncbi:hypothetical protein BGLA2_700115 [Burkholderia gladioli]|uniref:hypothetical protein n=1 Tax=Burkholderia gladioli TaxID=28095 RepID=UPI001CB06AAC|nr:hypothetical protein [Burkholderia gladioli]CAG9236244.1 hypothetical protein BGLA2_700115 [Burkholderia gladioli]
MTDFRLYPATPLDADPSTPVPRWQPNGLHGTLAQVEGFFAWVERDAAGDFAVHYLGRVSPPVPSLVEAQVLAPAFAWRVVCDRLQVNHTLVADVYHTAERLLLCAIVAKGKPLSSLNTMDAADYLERFLADPQPAERWIGRGRVERFDPAWRPFAGPLAARSRDTARRILTAMGAWLVCQQYLRVNPFDGLAAAAPAPIDTAGRTLTHAQWRYVLQTVWQPDRALGAAPDRSGAARAAQRDAVVLLLAYATGMRRAELAAAT